MADTICGLCGKCGRKTEWSIGHDFYDDNFSMCIRIVHTFVCEECGTSVKEHSWPTYQRIMRDRLGISSANKPEEA